MNIEGTLLRLMRQARGPVTVEYLRVRTPGHWDPHIPAAIRRLWRQGFIQPHSRSSGTWVLTTGRVATHPQSFVPGPAVNRALVTPPPGARRAAWGTPLPPAALGAGLGSQPYYRYAPRAVLGSTPGVTVTEDGQTQQYQNATIHNPQMVMVNVPPPATLSGDPPPKWYQKAVVAGVSQGLSQAMSLLMVGFVAWLWYKNRPDALKDVQLGLGAPRVL